MTDRQAAPVALTYAETGAFRRLVRRTAATRPLIWLYIRIQRPTDRLVYALTRGRATASSVLSGIPVVMLTTTGAKTGQPRTLPVVAIADGEGYVMIASNYGSPHHPAWYHNLRAHPQATVTADGVERPVEAHELTGEERDRAYREAAELHPAFDVYEQRTQGRTIPVLRLEPA
jgi:deazaflavin-dependent oxidoreductase (nitroreductase family)